MLSNWIKKRQKCTKIHTRYSILHFNNSRSFIGLLPPYPGVYDFRGVRLKSERPRFPWITFQIVLNSLQLAIEVWICGFLLWAARRSVFLWLVFHPGYFGLSGVRAFRTSMSRGLPQSLWFRGKKRNFKQFVCSVCDQYSGWRFPNFSLFVRSFSWARVCLISQNQLIFKIEKFSAILNNGTFSLLK